MALELFYFALLEEAAEQNDLSAEDRQRRDRRTPRIALRFYNQSSFLYLFNSGCNQALLNCCGVDHAVFRQLLSIFQPVFDRHTFDDRTGRIKLLKFTRSNKTFGRKRMIDATGCLGLVLYWFRTRGSVARSTAMAFGLTSTPMYKWLKFSRHLLVFVLHQHPLAKVCPPTQEEVNSYVEAIGAKYDLMGKERVWAAADGLKVRLQQSTNWAIQNYYYNGWLGSTYVNNVFVFAPDGKIRITVINAPGTWHDSTMADYGVYEKMERLFDLYGCRVVVDSAFNIRDNKGFLIKSAQEDPITENPEEVLAARQATSVRQLSEWGMRMIQGQFPRLKDPMIYEEYGERKVILMLVVLLYNFQTSTVGINQILNTFMSKTEGFYSYDGVTATANEVFPN